MKTIKKLTITVSYTVNLKNVKVPEEVYDDLIEHYKSESVRVPEDAIADKWLADNIREKDAVNWIYGIDNLD